MRFRNQTVNDVAGLFKGKNVRTASRSLVADLGADVNELSNPKNKTFGVVRLCGYEVPVVRVRGNKWLSLSVGTPYIA